MVLQRELGGFAVRRSLPTSEEMGLYVVHGRLRAKDTDMPEHSLVVLDNPQGVVIH
ncbi:hypothetical protein [Vibrio hepatarius]|uniref:hypothetical protein n=1 Tax=Vibrio hepatarius TaxID=171383 RepID=UPI00142E870A|nr:hypothetical protein [Vibrio hepatarius]NIY83115.1 hypothetical protein [Vibrio hepatarius]